MSKNTGNSTIIGISLFTYGKERWEEISCIHKYISLTLNLIVCQKRTLNPERISLQKRKAQHRRKRIQRKNYAKTKMQRARLTAGFFHAVVGVHLSNSLRLGSCLPTADKSEKINAPMPVLLSQYPHASKYNKAHNVAWGHATRHRIQLKE